MPSVAIHQGDLRCTLLKFAFDDDPFGLWKSTLRTMTCLLCHFLLLLSHLAYYNTLLEVMTRQPGYPRWRNEPITVKWGATEDFLIRNFGFVLSM